MASNKNDESTYAGTRHDIDYNAVGLRYGACSLTTLDGLILGTGDEPSGECVIGMDPLPIIGMKIRQGRDPLSGTITLNSLGMTLAFGGPTGAKIELSATGLTLSFGPAGAGPSIVLDARGITLKTGASNSIQVGQQGLSLEGLQVDLQALTDLKVKALQLSETATKVSRVGATTTMM